MQTVVLTNYLISAYCRCITDMLLPISKYFQTALVFM